MTEHPYKHLPPKAFWRRSVAGVTPRDVDPIGNFSLRISPESKVATAGSCFAQHIARYLKNSGFAYYVTEPGHPILSEPQASAQGYGVFTARFGNIYTARQLLQLYQRAYGLFDPQDDLWHDPSGRVIDPFRPTAQPGGFISEAEMRVDRSQHLAAVRQMFESTDVLIFTLGLTECWVSARDGAVYPVAPGVSSGTFDPALYCFHNQTVDEIVSDFENLISAVAKINREIQFVLTVSPVPLVATASPDANVLSATTYSKSVLRVAAEIVCNNHAEVLYFPSYEIITGPHSRGRYYAEDLRNVTEEGVAHVMRIFMKHAAGLEITSGQMPELKPAETTTNPVNDWIEVLCDEVALDDRC